MKSRRMQWRGISTHARDEKLYKIVVGKSEEKTPLGIPSRRWEYNIRMDLKEVGWEGVDWMHRTQDRYQ
jgi:hypothetical protein